jgi:hypothetical protein
MSLAKTYSNENTQVTTYNNASNITHATNFVGKTHHTPQSRQAQKDLKMRKFGRELDECEKWLNYTPGKYKPLTNAEVMENAAKMLAKKLPDFYEPTCYFRNCLSFAVRDLAFSAYTNIADTISYYNPFSQFGPSGAGATPVRQEEIEPIEDVVERKEFVKNPSLDIYQILTSRNPEDTARRRQILADFNQLIKEIKKAFVDAAKEGEETEKEIRLCLELTDPVLVHHKKWSKEHIYSVGIFSAAYNHDKNYITIHNPFGGKYITEMLIHECWHAIEHHSNPRLSFNITEIDDCQLKLTALKDKAIDCFDGKSNDCKQINEYAKSYKDKVVLRRISNKFNYKSGDFIEIDEFHRHSKKILTNAMVFQLKKALGIYAFIPHSVKINGYKTIATEDQKNLMSMVMLLDIRPQNFAEIKEMDVYKNVGIDMQAEEYYTNTLQSAPEKVRKAICPGNFKEKEGGKKGLGKWEF